MVRLIRAIPEISNLRILMMVRYGGNRRNTLTQLNEVNALLAKPVRRKSLLRAIEEVRSLDRPEVAATAVAIAYKKRARILVADDNRTNQEVASAMLQDLGYEVDVVLNGLEALDAMQVKSYDLVLMDCLMP